MVSLFWWSLGKRGTYKYLSLYSLNPICLFFPQDLFSFLNFIFLSFSLCWSTYWSTSPLFSLARVSSLLAPLLLLGSLLRCSWSNASVFSFASLGFSFGLFELLLVLVLLSSRVKITRLLPRLFVCAAAHLFLSRLDSKPTLTSLACTAPDSSTRTLARPAQRVFVLSCACVSCVCCSFVLRSLFRFDIVSFG